MRRLHLLLVALMPAIISPLSSLAAQRVTLFGGGGLGIGVGDLSENTDSGWLGYAGLDFLIASRPGVTVGVTGSYSHVPYQGTFGEATNLTAVFAEIGYLIGATSTSLVKPYIRGGVGVIQFKYDQGATGYTSTKNSGIGASGGAGLVFDFRPASLFLGAHVLYGSEGGVLAFHGGLAYALGGSAPRR